MVNILLNYSKNNNIIYTIKFNKVKTDYRNVPFILKEKKKICQFGSVYHNIESEPMPMSGGGDMH